MRYNANAPPSLEQASRHMIPSKHNGNGSIIKTDLFYKTTNIKINKRKNPVIILRGRNAIGFTIYISKVYDLIFGWNENNEEKEIRIRPTIFSGIVKPSSLKKFNV